MPALPPMTSANRLISDHHSSLPRLSFMSEWPNTSSIVAYTILLPRMAIIAAVSAEYFLVPFCCWKFGVACSSKNCMHRNESRAARVRSSGDGTPPWRV